MDEYIKYRLKHNGRLYELSVYPEDSDWYLDTDMPIHFYHRESYRGPLLSPLGENDHGMNPKDFFEWVDNAKGAEKPEVVEVYLLDHSMYRVSTSPFRDPWDSGLAGYLAVEYDEWKKWYGNGHRWRIRARKAMESWVEMLDQVFTGAYYLYSLVETRYLTDDEGLEYSHEEILDSLGGIIGTDHLRDEVNATLEYHHLPTRGWEYDKNRNYVDLLHISDPPRKEKAA